MKVELIVILVIVFLVIGIFIGHLKIEHSVKLAFKKAKVPISIVCWSSNFSVVTHQIIRTF